MINGWQLAGVLAAALLTGSAAAQGHRITDKDCGLEVELPGADWKRTDHSASGVVVHVYSPKRPPMPPMPRVTLLRYPSVFLAQGMKTRANQVEATPALQRKRFEKTRLCAQEATVYEYEVAGSRTVEYGLRTADGKAWLIVQVAARLEDWKDEAKAASFQKVFTSARLVAVEGRKTQARVEGKTPRQIREARAVWRPEEQPFAVRSHDIKLTLEPAQGRLEVIDALEVEALADGLARVELTLTHLQVDKVELSGKPLEWERQKDQAVILKLPEALDRGGRIKVVLEGHSDRYRHAQDQKLVAEVAVLGQVEEASSFSSHVYYYPVDRRNDAPVSMAITVPAGYTAVTGGEFLGHEDDAEGKQRTFRYRMSVRTPRALPMGFACGKYRKISGMTAAGLELDFYYLPGKEKAARQRLAVAIGSGGLFEKLMGPLPWRRVAFCHVRPWRKETGVSLPGLVLLSDGFFGDAEGVKLSGASMNDPRVLGLLLVADELSHQWNFYSLPLPNELAEGISTFTNLLYIEQREGRAEYDKGLEFCAQAYLKTVELHQDVAVADPALYRSQVYRVVAFCKVPVILDLLRHRLGDEVFHGAWRHAFTTLRGDRGGYDALCRALGKAAGQDLRSFFDQWFFQAGHPRLEVSWSMKPQKGEGSDDARPTLNLAVRQAQPGGLFDVWLRVTADCGDGKNGKDGKKVDLGKVRVDRRNATLGLTVPGPVTALTVEPEGGCPLIPVRVRRSSQ